MVLLKTVQSQWAREQQTDISAEERVTASRALEDRGEYSNAHALLSEFSAEIGEWPKVIGLPPHLQAAVLLRVGVVWGWVGSAEAIEGGNQFALELILAAFERFNGLALNEQAGECLIEAGWCCWRLGRRDDARAHFHRALSLLPDKAQRLRAKAHLRLGIVESSAGRHKLALELYDSVNELFNSLSPADIIRASLHNERALIFKNLATAETRDEYLNRALAEYTTSLFHGKKAKHKRHCAIVENNIGNVHIQLGQFSRGFAHLERAGKMFKSLGDVRTFAQVEETRAQALIEQRRYAEAVKVISGTIRTLEKVGEQSLLCETLITLGTALARQEQAEDAHNTLMRAVAEATEINDCARAGLAWLVILEEADRLLLSDAQRRSALIEAVKLLEGSQDPKIKARLLSCAVSLATQQMPTRPQAPDPEQFLGVPLKEAVRRFKKYYIQQAVDAANGNRSAAARALGMTASGIHALLAGTYKDVRHEGMKKYRRSHIRPVVDDVAEWRARKKRDVTIKKKPGSIEIHLKTDHLASLGPRVGDWVVAEEGPVKEGDLAAVELNDGTGAVGYYRRSAGRIILEVGSIQFDPFELDEAEVSRVIGKVYGWLKAGEEDVEVVRQFD